MSYGGTKYGVPSYGRAPAAAAAAGTTLGGGYGTQEYATVPYAEVEITVTAEPTEEVAGLVTVNYVPQLPTQFVIAGVVTVNYVPFSPPFVERLTTTPTINYVEQAATNAWITTPDFPPVDPLNPGVTLPADLYGVGLARYNPLTPLSYTPPFPDAQVYMDVRVEGWCRLEVESDPTTLTVTADPTQLDVL